ncbi:MAG: hypothetical protein ABWX61_02715 [Paenisporosarcina sp.]
MWEDVYQTFFDLPDDEKEKFIRAIEQLNKKLPYDEQITSLLLRCCRKSNYTTDVEIRLA